VKKFLSIIFVSLLLSGSANATMKGIFEVDLLVESLNKYAKECSLTRDSIVTTVKYIMQNSKIKIKKADAYLPTLYVKVGLIKSGNVCTADIDISVESLDAKDPLGLENYGFFLFYRNGVMTSGGSPSVFANSVINAVEEIMKDLVVEHHEDNS
jgi:hypothetical protein